MVCEKKHLSDIGFERIVELRRELRALGKKAKTYHGMVSEFDKKIEYATFGKREGAGKPLAPC